MWVGDAVEEEIKFLATVLFGALFLRVEFLIVLLQILQSSNVEVLEPRGFQDDVLMGSTGAKITQFSLGQEFRFDAIMIGKSVYLLDFGRALRTQILLADVEVKSHELPSICLQRRQNRVYPIEKIRLHLFLQSLRVIRE